jgi:hypothetical protein
MVYIVVVVRAGRKERIEDEKEREGGRLYHPTM